MSPQYLVRHHYQCCGTEVSFFEQCGHTTIEVDHHLACEHGKADNTYLSPQAASHQPRSLTLLAPTKQPFPQPYPKCKDLHRYISLIDANCPSCTTAPQIGSWDPNISSFSSTWSPLSEAEIFERGVYWLNEMLLAREEEYQGKLADWEAAMREKREVEETFNISLLERTFGYDPSGVRGDFLRKVERGGRNVSPERWKCGSCQGEMGNVMIRTLPCGCVLHLKCAQRWFVVRKSCPDCDVGFKLAKIPRKVDTKLKGAEYPIWEDDNYTNFI